MTMRIFAITKPGLVALSLSVLSLWTCVGVEAATRRHATLDAVESIRTLARLRQLTHDPGVGTPTREPVQFVRRHRPFAS